MLNRVFLLLCFLYFFTSCQKSTSDFINISFTPAEQYEIRNSGEIIPFSIRLSSNIELSELVIVQIVNNSIIDTMYHEQISGLEKTEPYYYTCPDISSLDVSEVKLIFYCSNTNITSLEGISKRIDGSISSNIKQVNESFKRMQYLAGV